MSTMPSSAPQHGAELAIHRAATWLTAHGISLLGSRILCVPGRRTGTPRATLVNLLHHDGGRYLVAPRGQTQWVRNLRAAGEAELRLGRRVEVVTATEMVDADKPELLRAYLRRWRFEVGRFFQGVGPEAPIEELRRIAPEHPVFRLEARDAAD